MSAHAGTEHSQIINKLWSRDFPTRLKIKSAQSCLEGEVKGLHVNRLAWCHTDIQAPPMSSAFQVCRQWARTGTQGQTGPVVSAGRVSSSGADISPSAYLHTGP